MALLYSSGGVIGGGAHLGQCLRYSLHVPGQAGKSTEGERALHTAGNEKTKSNESFWVGTHVARGGLF